MRNVSNIPPAVMQHYKVASKWKSDLEYFLRESRFLHHLCDGYYMDFSSEYYIRQLKTIESALYSLDREIKQIAGFLNTELVKIDRLLNGTSEQGSKGQINLTDIKKKLNQFQLKFRALKENLFQFVENTRERNQTLAFLDKFA